MELVIYCKVHFNNMYIGGNWKKKKKKMNIFWSAFDLSEKVELGTGPLDKHNKYDCLMGHSHSESNCNLHNTWLHISPSLKGTSLQKKYLPITPPDDLLFSSIYSAKPSLVSCFFYHFKLELAQLLRFNYPSTIIQKILSEKFVAIVWFSSYLLFKF